MAGGTGADDDDGAGACGSDGAGRTGEGDGLVGDGRETAFVGWEGCGVAGGVGCGVGFTTTTRGAARDGGVDGNCTDGRPSIGFG